jgi:hypothetical protein
LIEQANPTALLNADISGTSIAQILAHNNIDADRGCLSHEVLGAKIKFEGQEFVRKTSALRRARDSRAT